MLVEYSDSDSESESEDRKHRLANSEKKEANAPTSPPPLPPSFHSLYATNIRTATADDPSLHGGRSRQVPHREGNWPTHVYIEWIPTTDSFSKLQRVLNCFQPRTSPESKIFSLLRSDLGVQLPLHISLSAPLVLTAAQKDDFCQALQQGIASSGARPFTVRPTGVSWVPNFDNTRYFLVMRLSKPVNDDLNKLLSACNSCARKLNLHRLYDQTANIKLEADKQSDRISAFHVSIAWTLQKPVNEDHETMDAAFSHELGDLHIHISSMHIKIGNLVTEAQLPE